MENIILNRQILGLILPDLLDFDWFRHTGIPDSITHWSKNPQFIQKLPFWKYHFSQNSLFENIIFHKIHLWKISFFTKSTFSNSHFSQNSLFENIIIHKIRIFKHQILSNFWIKKWVFALFNNVKDYLWQDFLQK